LINIVADRALLAAYARDEVRIGPDLVARAANEVFGRSRRESWWPWAAAATGLALLLTGVLIEDGNRSGGEPGRALAEAAAPAALAAMPGAEPEANRSTDLVTGNETSGTTSLAGVLAGGDSSADAARAALFTLWGAEYTAASDDDVCTQAESQQLRCLRVRNISLGEIRVLNRPVDIELLAGDGSVHHVVLAGLGDKHAVVRAGDAMERIDIADLTLFTFGEQLLLFRPAVADRAGSLAEGARGPGVVWLRTSLASLYDRTLSDDAPDLFDAALAAAVREYQRDRGLFVDGVVGDRTLINLQTELGLIDVSLKAGMH
jgi:general secretion pathway protein A